MMHDPEIAAERIGLKEMLQEAKRELAMRRNVYPKLIGADKLREDNAQRQLLRQQKIVAFFEWALPREAGLRRLPVDPPGQEESSDGKP